MRTPNRPRIILGMARAALMLGDNVTARKRYEEFLFMWRDADSDCPELVTAKAALHSLQ